MALDDHALDILFRAARTKWQWTAEPVTDEDLAALYELVKLGPTSGNCSPARFVFVRTAEGKEKLQPALSPGNFEKTMAAPVTVIVAYDPLFYNHLPKLFPAEETKVWYSGNPDLARDTAFRNSTLQGAYMILAARALGMDCGPMSGFDHAKVDLSFFAKSGWKSNFLLNLGHGVAEHPFERLPRLTFEEATLFA
jgi:3-hydroxypropanoate dehydrogenase